MIGDYDGAVRSFAAKIFIQIVKNQGSSQTEQLGLEWIHHPNDTIPTVSLTLSTILIGSQNESSDDYTSLFSCCYDRDSLCVTLPLEHDLYSDVQKEIGRRKIMVVPIFFSQGINEHQSIAIHIGDTSLQERINRDGLNILAFYWQKLKRFWVEERKKDGGTSYDENIPNELDEKISVNFENLKRYVKTSRRYGRIFPIFDLFYNFLF
jgi:hypothetical protein